MTETGEKDASLWEVDGDPDLLAAIPEQDADAQEPTQQDGNACKLASEPADAPGIETTALESADAPAPSLEQILEAMLFLGSDPLSSDRAQTLIRGLDADRFTAAIDTLARKYRRQNRPCVIEAFPEGYQLQVRPRFQRIRDKLFGSPREARLTQPALDVLSLIAYRQPIDKPELDSLRGADVAAPLRQLLRLGLITVLQRGQTGAQPVAYGTTARFLSLFGLRNLEDLPRLSDPARL